jgi:hypothetical protein
MDPEQEQVQHQLGLGEIQDLSQVKILNEHSIVPTHSHAHY